MCVCMYVCACVCVRVCVRACVRAQGFIGGRGGGHWESAVHDSAQGFKKIPPTPSDKNPV